MQFDSNSDYPAPSNSNSTAEAEARRPLPFPTAQINQCARITTRIYIPKHDRVETVSDVLVEVAGPCRDADGGVVMATGGGINGRSTRENTTGVAGVAGAVEDDNSMSSVWSSSDSSYGDTDMDYNGPTRPAGPTGTVSQPFQPERAYWMQRTLREAIYGRVRYGIVLRRRPPSPVVTPGQPVPQWEITDEKCAVKEMSWNHIRREKGRLAEDPIKEVSAMQHLRRHLEMCSGLPEILNGQEAMLSTNIMLPLDLMSDDRYLYSVMPFCDGGELFDRLDTRSKFSEEEARYWMLQILNGLENLQRAGVCHRDMSLENLLVHNDRICLVIDMGMCLRIPYDGLDGENDDENKNDAMISLDRQLQQSFANISMNMDVEFSGSAEADGTGNDFSRKSPCADLRSQKRFLIGPSGTCGKWQYMSPEIANNKEPFDGHAVDMWATGVILFLMLTGFPPWERPSKTDERFKYMTAGYLVQMLTEWELGLSPDAMDLLQRMMWVDPRDRLSMEQVRAHPWMVNGNSTLT